METKEKLPVKEHYKKELKEKYSKVKKNLTKEEIKKKFKEMNEKSLKKVSKVQKIAKSGLSKQLKRTVRKPRLPGQINRFILSNRIRIKLRRVEKK